MGSWIALNKKYHLKNETSFSSPGFKMCTIEMLELDTGITNYEIK